MRRIAPFFFILALGSVFTLTWLTHKRQPEPTPRAGGMNPQALQAYLSGELRKATPGSAAEKRLLQSLKKVRAKVNGLQRPENPAALQEAFAQLKTNARGQTYLPGYRQRALTQAKRKLKSKRASQPWVERGPGNVSGRVRTVVVDPGDATGNTWFIASVGGGIWKTVDGGITWRELTANLATLTTTTLTQCRSNPNVLYAGTGMGYGRIVDLKGSGVWKSTDRGETWFQLPSTANGELLEAINRIVVDPNDENTVLVCSNDGFSHLGPKGGTRKSGIFRSADGGQTWTQVFDANATLGVTTDNRVQQIVADPTNFNLLYAAVNEVGVIRSTDAGQTWVVSAGNFAAPGDIGNPTSNGFGLAGISVRVELAIAPSDPSRIYAAVERPRGIADLFMSKDRGLSWVLVNDSGNDPNWFSHFGASGATGVYTAGWFDNTIAVHPYNPNIVYVGGINIFQLNIDSTNDVRSSSLLAFWTQNNTGTPIVHADHHWLELLPLDAASGTFRIIDANDGGLTISDDGGQSWRAVTGMRTTQFYGAAKKPGEDVYIGGTQDNGTWLSGNNPQATSSWIGVFGGDGFEAVWHRTNPNLILGGAQNNALRRSTDGGQTWPRIFLPNPGRGPFITKLAYSQTDPDLVFAISSSGVFRSDDFGASWTLTPISGNWLGYRPFDNVEISTADPQVVWITSRLDVDPPARRSGGIHVSQDGGLSFREVSANFPAGMTEASGLGLDPTDANTAYFLFAAPGFPKILRTRDLGQTFEDLTQYQNGRSGNDFPEVAVFSLLVMPNNPNILWAGTEIGLFVSEDGGSSWSFDNSLPHVAVFQLSTADDQVIAATQGRGIWTLTLPELAQVSLPQTTFAPRLAGLSFEPTGNLAIQFDQRSAYSQTQVLINGRVGEALPANANPGSKRLLFPLDNEGPVSVQIQTEKDGRTYKSARKQVTVFPREPRVAYTNNLDNVNDTDFELSGFIISAPAGFGNPLLVTPNPYPNNINLIAKLKHPLVVPPQNAALRFDELVLVEPGTGSGVFGDPQFWDFVVVEGTRDGITWLPLAPGYDSRADTAWLNAFNNGSNPTAALLRPRELDLLTVFNPGDQVQIRFRLLADAAVSGWGWAIDNLTIFPDAQSSQKPLQHRTLFPWISSNAQFESILVINNPGDTPARYTLAARRESGCGQKTNSRTIPANGFITATAAELFSTIAAGPGLTVVLDTDTPAVRGRWVTNNLTAATGRSPSQGVGIQVNNSGNTSQRSGMELVFNYLPQSGGFIAGPVIVNQGNQPTDVVLSFYKSDGTLVLEDSTSLKGLQPNRPFARIANDLVPAANEDLYLIARSSTTVISGVVFVFNGQGETAIGNATAVNHTGQTESRRMYSWVSNSAAFDSLLVANNLSGMPVDVDLTAQRANGEMVTVQKRIPANGFLREQAAVLFPELGLGAGYSVTLSAPQPGVYGAWVTNNLQAASGRSPSQGIAVSLATGGQPASSERVGSAILFGYLPIAGDFIAAPVIVNVGTQIISADLTGYNRQGTLVFETTLTNLVPGSPTAAVMSTLAPNLTEDIYLIARSQQGPITGVAFVFNAGHEPAIGNVTALE